MTLTAHVDDATILEPRLAQHDPTLNALTELARTLEQNAEAQRVLATRIRDAQRARMGGSSWTDVLNAESDPGTMQLVSQNLNRLSKASGSLRTNLVVALREEGVSIPAIARLFGVTHQRVSNLLRKQ
jgi:hypothetical protein